MWFLVEFEHGLEQTCQLCLLSLLTNPINFCVIQIIKQLTFEDFKLNLQFDWHLICFLLTKLLKPVTVCFSISFQKSVNFNCNHVFVFHVTIYN